MIHRALDVLASFFTHQTPRSLLETGLQAFFGEPTIHVHSITRSLSKQFEFK